MRRAARGLPAGGRAAPSERAALLATVLLAAAPSPVMAGAYTLCQPNETVVFSCSTGARFLSICASRDVSKSRGYMQYRFGQRGRPELAYPARDEAPARAFTYGSLAFSGGGGTYLILEKAPFRYTVFSAIGKWGRNGAPASVAGVSVGKEGSSVADIACQAGGNSVPGEFGPDFFDKIGIAATQEPFDIPVSVLP